MKSGCLSTLIVMILGVFYTGMGFSGLENQLGIFFAGAALTALILFGSTLPLTVGTYFYTTNTLNWHWVEGLLFVIVLSTIVIPLVMKSAHGILNPINSEK